MGIFSHLLAHIVSDAAKESRKEKEKNQKWNTTFSMLQQKETELQNYLNSVGCKLSYVFDADVIDNGNVSSEVRKMEKIRKDVEEYLALGGNIQLLFDFDRLERHIGVLRYLRKIGQVHRQLEFLDDNKYSVEDKIKAENEALAQQVALFREEQKNARQARVNRMVGGDIDTLSGIDFEGVCQQLVEKMGFQTETTKASGDGGIDLIARNYQPLLSGKYIIQCKRYSGSVGEPIIRDLYGVVMSERANKGILMTTGYFTRSAVAFAEGKPIELIDGEQLKALLLQYNVCSVENFSDVSSVSAFCNTFDPEPFMGYYYEEYLDMKGRVDKDPGDIRSRCKLIEIIYTTIRMRLYPFELGDKGAYVINPYDLQEMFQLLRDNLQIMLKFDNSHSPNKRLQTIYYITMLLDGQAAVYSADFVSAAERFGTVLRDWDPLKEEELTFTQILYSLFGVFKLSGCPEMIEQYSQKYNKYISYCKNIYRKSDDFMKDFHAEQLEVLNHPNEVTQFISMSIDNFYDECVRDSGDINISNGFGRIDVNVQKNSMFYCGRQHWKNKGQEMTLIENFDVLSTRQRDLVAHVARMYL